MKRILSLMLVGIMTLTMLVGCGSVSNENIKIKKYKGLEVEKVVAAEVTDEDVEASIKSDLETLATTEEIKNRPAQMGDIVVIDFVGKENGVEFEGGSGTDTRLELGTGTFIPGFEEGVVGKNIGQTFDLNLTFPKDYTPSPDMAGKAVVFTVTLKSITAKHVPELTVDVLSKLGSTAKTIEEYKAQVKENLKDLNAKNAEDELKTKIKEALLEQSKVKDCPDKTLIEATKKLVFEESYAAYMSGINIDTYIMDTYEMSVELKAKEMAILDLAFDLIAKKEKISISTNEYETAVTQLAAEYDFTDKNEFVQSYEGIYGSDYIKDSLLEDKIMQFLIDNCKQVEAKAEK